MAVVNNNTCISCKSIGVIMHVSKIQHGKRGVTGTTAWSVIQECKMADNGESTFVIK